MKILVLGASGGTGALSVKAALAAGHAVTAFARTPSKLDLTNPQLFTRRRRRFLGRGVRVTGLRRQGGRARRLIFR
jgi:uncharacterized protein YbjT (DUF2867 family)